MEYYDIGQKKWILAENMNSPRTMFSVTHIHDYIYAFGGFTDSQYNFVEHNMERYSISNDTWEVLEIENKFGFLGGSVINRTREGQILILGGINPASPNPEHKEHKLHLYTPEDNSLVELNARGLEMQTPKFFTSNGTIFNCLGGSSSFRFLEYNLQYDSWGVKASEADQQKFLAQLNSLEVLEGASIYQLLATSTVISHQSF
eukprot:CAMPEP_0196997432 /NCGR_PEP_ID=MMETSP1380-20130617/3049_1 /TAXON_ID=5936 /ORGANISM="Euplotes crassus, Strain CT5" /LENGTH=202 /DNA_ID=CAMNT_0042413663 /DNA_START=346 /DNA_END=951 /DNA_ORIENTATION=-